MSCLPASDTFQFQFALLFLSDDCKRDGWSGRAHLAAKVLWIGNAPDVYGRDHIAGFQSAFAGCRIGVNRRYQHASLAPPGLSLSVIRPKISKTVFLPSSNGRNILGFKPTERYRRAGSPEWEAKKDALPTVVYEPSTWLFWSWT